MTSLVVTVGTVGPLANTTVLLWGITSRVTLSVATRVTSVVLGTIEGIVATDTAVGLDGDFVLTMHPGWVLRFGLPLSNDFHQGRRLGASRGSLQRTQRWVRE